MTTYTATKKPQLMAISASSDDTLNLDKTRLYTLFHTGKNSSGVASTGDVFVNTDAGAVVKTYANGDGKMVVQNGGSFPLPPNTEQVKLQAATAEVTLLLLAGAKDPQTKIV